MVRRIAKDTKKDSQSGGEIGGKDEGDAQKHRFSLSQIPDIFERDVWTALAFDIL